VRLKFYQIGATRARVTLDLATFHPIAHAYLAHVVGEMTGILVVWDFGTPEEREE
jgi:hypothetical protein